MTYLTTKKTTRKPKKPLSETVHGSIIALSFVSIGLMSFTSLSYLAHKNATATKAYQLRDLEVEHKNLLEKGGNQGVQLAKKKSLKLILEDDLISKMPLIETPLYIRSDTALAKK